MNIIESNSKGNYKQVQFLNIVSYLAMLIINFLANYLPINGKDTGYISDLYPNLFAPAGFTFAIWGLIYLLLGFFIIYQAQGLFSKKSKQLTYVNRISYLFFISSLLNIAWIFAWHYLQILLSLFIMILLLITLIVLYQRLNINDNIEKEAGGLLVKIAFSVYLGWITIATVANVTTTLVAIEWNMFALSEVFWMVIVMIVATLIVLSFMFKNRDWVYGLVALWAYVGIIFKRISAAEIEYTVVFVTIALSLIIAAAIIKLMMTNEKKRL